MNVLKMKKLIEKIVFITSLLIIIPGYTQELDLFQAVDNPEVDGNNSRRPERNQRSSLEPAFTLVGTSRFGEKYLASLRARDGSSIVMEWTKGIVQEIKGYNGYGLAEVNGRTVSIRLPEDENCIPSEEKGVECTGNIAVLRLSNAEPTEFDNTPVSTQNNEKTSEAGESADDGVQTDPGEGETRTITNPFTGETQELPALTAEEQAARDARRSRREEQFRNFEIVRIADDEIPEGMQRIRTPFGDRLEPAEE